jgi:hypothetical protein
MLDSFGKHAVKRDSSQPVRTPPPRRLCSISQAVAPPAPPILAAVRLPREWLLRTAPRSSRPPSTPNTMVGPSSLGIGFCAAACTTYSGWGAEFRYRHVETIAGLRSNSPKPMNGGNGAMARAMMSSPKSSAFCFCRYLAAVLCSAKVPDAPRRHTFDVCAPLGAGLSV